MLIEYKNGRIYLAAYTVETPNMQRSLAIFFLVLVAASARPFFPWLNKNKEPFSGSSSGLLPSRPFFFEHARQLINSAENAISDGATAVASAMSVAGQRARDTVGEAVVLAGTAATGAADAVVSTGSGIGQYAASSTIAVTDAVSVAGQRTRDAMGAAADMAGSAASYAVDNLGRQAVQMRKSAVDAWGKQTWWSFIDYQERALTAMWSTITRSLWLTMWLLASPSAAFVHSFVLALMLAKSAMVFFKLLAPTAADSYTFQRITRFSWVILTGAFLSAIIPCLILGADAADEHGVKVTLFTAMRHVPLIATFSLGLAYAAVIFSFRQIPTHAFCCLCLSATLAWMLMGASIGKFAARSRSSALVLLIVSNIKSVVDGSASSYFKWGACTTFGGVATVVSWLYAGPAAPAVSGLAVHACNGFTELLTSRAAAVMPPGFLSALLYILHGIQYVLHWQAFLHALTGRTELYLGITDLTGFLAGFSFVWRMISASSKKQSIDIDTGNGVRFNPASENGEPIAANRQSESIQQDSANGQIAADDPS